MLFVLCVLFIFFFFKQKTAYEMRISDWSSDVCSSDLAEQVGDDEFADGGNENEEAAGDDAGERQRPGDDPERLDGTTAKVGRRLQQADAHLLKVGVERQHHEGPVGIPDADEDCGVGVSAVHLLVAHAATEAEMGRAARRG